MNTENNKLIAEFLGKKYKDNYVVIGDWAKCTQNPSGEVWEQCKYHSDWNWLMEVVDKIESIEDLERFEITTFNVLIQYYETKQKRFDYNLYFSTIDVGAKVIPKIKGVYNACVEFIKWYNEQK